MKNTQSLKIHVRTLHPLLQPTSQSNEHDSKGSRPNVGQNLQLDFCYLLILVYDF